jgi:two-component system OmpR family response regulator
MRTTDVRLLIVNYDEELPIDATDYLKRQNISVGFLRENNRLDVQLDELAPSLVLLYHRSQRADGFGLLKDIRASSDVPVIMIAGPPTDEVDRVVGLELGADDCLTSPFCLRELVARIRAVLRRNMIRRELPRRDLTSVVYKFSGWRLHQSTGRLINSEESTIILSPRERALLIAFVTAPGRTLSREYLMNATQVDGDSFDRAIDCLVYRLRRKLNTAPSAPPTIETERGYGYRFSALVERVAFK